MHIIQTLIHYPLFLPIKSVWDWPTLDPPPPVLCKPFSFAKELSVMPVDHVQRVPADMKFYWMRGTINTLTLVEIFTYFCSGLGYLIEGSRLTLISGVDWLLARLPPVLGSLPCYAILGPTLVSAWCPGLPTLHGPA